MPTFNEIIVTKKTDIAWDGGKATENLIPNDGDLVFDSTGGGRSAHEAPLLDELGWATDNNRADSYDFTYDDGGLSGGNLSVLLGFGEPVTFTATVSPNSPPASPEPVTHAGDLVFDPTGGGSFDLVFPTQTPIKEVSGLKVEHAVIDFSPDQDNGLLLPAVQTGGVSVASGDVNGDNSALGDPVTFTLTVEPSLSLFNAFMTIETIPDGGVQSLAVDPTNPNMGSDGSVRLADASDLFVFDGNSQPIGDQNSPPASPAPDNSRGYTAGHFALEFGGHNASSPVDYGTGSFIR